MLEIERSDEFLERVAEASEIRLDKVRFWKG